MKRWLFASFVLLNAGVIAQEEPPPPEKLEKELEEAEKEFKEAKKMFNPWYAGPLLTGGAHVLPPGLVNIQPYLFVTNNYAKFDEHGHSKDITNINVVNPQLFVQAGIFKWMDAIVSGQFENNRVRTRNSTNIGDTGLYVGFGLLKESPYAPAIKIAFRESFPTGKYQRLDPKRLGTDATGAGSYQTNISFNVSKVVWWITTHPMNVRFSLNWTIPSNVEVHGFNAYGGGFGTDGTVHPGQSVGLSFGYEYSFTQRWVFALDIVYTYAAKTTFSGKHGVDSDGNRASVGGPFNDNLSFAPAIEYNPNEDFGVVAGVWFSAWGRNSLNFVSGVFTFTYTF